MKFGFNRSGGFRGKEKAIFNIDILVTLGQGQRMILPFNTHVA